MMNLVRGASHGGALVPLLEIEDIDELQENDASAEANTPEVAPTSGENAEDSQLYYVVCTTQHGRAPG